MARRGAFIVFEGCDRAGKTTQCKKLVEALNKKAIPAELMNFPDRSTSIGQIISDYLTKKIELPDKAVHLLFAANRWELEPKIREKIESGITLIVDRYSYSGVAFSAAKKDMDLKWCWNPEIGLPEPDAVFLLKLDEEASAKRGGFGEERYERKAFQRKVKHNYTLLETSLWNVIDAEKTVEDLHSEILHLFSTVYEKSSRNPLNILKDISVCDSTLSCSEKSVSNNDSKSI